MRGRHFPPFRKGGLGGIGKALGWQRSPENPPLKKGEAVRGGSDISANGPNIPPG